MHFRMVFGDSLCTVPCQRSNPKALLLYVHFVHSPKAPAKEPYLAKKHNSLFIISPISGDIFNLEVRVGNSPINATNPPTNNALCKFAANATRTDNVANLMCDQPTRGRYVSLMRRAMPGWLSWLAVCEVQVG